MFLGSGIGGHASQEMYDAEFHSLIMVVAVRLGSLSTLACLHHNQCLLQGEFGIC